MARPTVDAGRPNKPRRRMLRAAPAPPRHGPPERKRRDASAAVPKIIKTGAGQGERDWRGWVGGRAWPAGRGRLACGRPATQRRGRTGGAARGGSGLGRERARVGACAGLRVCGLWVP